MSRAELTLKVNERNVGIAFAIALLVPWAVFYEESMTYYAEEYPLSARLVMWSAFFGLVVMWLIGMFFIVRAIHRPWRKARIAASVWIGLYFTLGGILPVFLDGLVYEYPEELFVAWVINVIAWVIAASYWTGSINKRVKRAEERRKKKEKKGASEWTPKGAFEAEKRAHPAPPANRKERP